MDTEGENRRGGLRRRAQVGCEGIKAMEFLGWNISLQGHQLRLFLCYCTVNKWFYGTRHLRCCWGKPEVEPVRKPGLSVNGVCGESSRVPVGSLELAPVKGIRSKLWKSVRSVMGREPWEWSGWKVSWTLACPVRLDHPETERRQKKEEERQEDKCY